MKTRPLYSVTLNKKNDAGEVESVSYFVTAKSIASVGKLALKIAKELNAKVTYIARQDDGLVRQSTIGASSASVRRAA